MSAALTVRGIKSKRHQIRWDQHIHHHTTKHTHTHTLDLRTPRPTCPHRRTPASGKSPSSRIDIAVQGNEESTSGRTRGKDGSNVRTLSLRLGAPGIATRVQSEQGRYLQTWLLALLRTEQERYERNKDASALRTGVFSPSDHGVATWWSYNVISWCFDSEKCILE